VVRIGAIQRRQPFDALDPVGNRVGMNAQDPGGLLEAFVLVQVDGQGPGETDLVPGTVVVDTVLARRPGTSSHGSAMQTLPHHGHAPRTRASSFTVNEGDRL
jgi:hypothetical protein